MRLDSKRILAAGGASGLGLAAVERCLQAGASVVTEGRGVFILSALIT